MKKAIMLFFVISLALFLAGCAQPQEEPAGSPHPNESTAPAGVSVSGGINETIMPGSDRDAHGCIPSAGYSWCEEKQECLRSWEENCTTEPPPPEAECTTVADCGPGSASCINGTCSQYDEHGCVPDGGYTWCEPTQKCIRPWEENCTIAQPTAPESECTTVADCGPGSASCINGTCSQYDEHGCIPSAGYAWCEPTQKCYRPWEGGCTSGEEETAETAPKAQFRKGPYLLFSGNSNNMTVLWQTNDTPQNARIAWGTTTQYNGGRAAVQESGDHQFSYTIGGLEASTIYYYAVYVDGTREEGSFGTAPSADATSITFYSYGDTRSDPHESEQYQLARDKIAGQIVNCTLDNPAEHQTILIHTGDYVARGLTESFWDDEYFNRTLRNSTNMLSRLPVVGSIGNHETYAAGGSGEDNENAGALFRKYWPNPLFATGDCFYYSFDYGPAHFVAIDQYKCDYDNTSAQYAWVEADLAATEKPWKIVFFHAPAWTAAEPAGSEEINESAEEENTMAREYTSLFTQEGVQLVLQGHRHFYARSHVNGTVYLTLGGGGAPLGSPQDAPYLVTSAGVYHFARVEINGSTADVQILGDDSGIVDSFSIDE